MKISRGFDVDIEMEVEVPPCLDADGNMIPMPAVQDLPEVACPHN